MYRNLREVSFCTVRAKLYLSIQLMSAIAPMRYSSCAKFLNNVCDQTAFAQWDYNTTATGICNKRYPVHIIIHCGISREYNLFLTWDEWSYLNIC